MDSSTPERGQKRLQAAGESFRMIAAILYRLKTGCQWRELPVKAFFEGAGLSWQGVYHHFRRWAGDGSLKKVWTQLLQSKRRLLNLSSMQLDGSQTLCKNGGEHVGYQARKAAKTCNSLFEIKAVLRELCGLLQEAGIETEGLFLNPAAGFDSESFRRLCSEMKIEANIAFNPRNGRRDEEYVYFNEELFKKRTIIEHASAWLDSFKALLIRFETKARHWVALNLLAFTLLFIRKIIKKL